MAGLLYFVPERDRTITLDQVRELGLGYAFERRVVGSNATGAIDGRNGVVLADPTRVEGHRIRYLPDRQTWRKIPGLQGEAWVGCYTGGVQPPDVARADQLQGHWVTLGDDQQWLAPVARALTEQDDDLRWHNPLPTATTIDDDGNWVDAGVLPRYRHLWPIATAFWDAWANAESDDDEQEVQVAFDFTGSRDAALAALAANYRIGKAEVASLGLFNQQAVASILQALIDWPAVEGWLRKKREQGGSSTAGGPGD